MTTTASLAIESLLKACHEVQCLAEITLKNENDGLPPPWEDGEREFLERAITLMSCTLYEVNLLILETNSHAHRPVHKAATKRTLYLVAKQEDR